MAANPSIDAATAEQIFTLLRSLAQPLAEADARTLVSQRGWVIDADAPGEGLVATGDWPGATEAVMFIFDGGDTTHFTIAAYSASATDPDSTPIAIDTFAMLVREATDMFGTRTAEIISDSPRAWWTLPEQTISISRGNSSATIMWATHEDHEDLVRSAAREDA